jgi:hypothetical protein
MASFGAVSFVAGIDSFQENREGRVTIIEIPGGDNFYVDLAGRTPLKLNLNILLASLGAWATLNTLLGTEASLVVETLDTHDAVLMSLSRPAQQPDGQTIATAQFVITDA